MSEHMSPIPSMIYNAAVGGHVTNSQQIIDENLNKEQQDINEEVAAIPYNSTTPNGMGKIVLKKNDNFKQVIEAQTNGNTIFVIKYDFTLTGNVTVPTNCVLEFNGGSISGDGTGKDTLSGDIDIIAPSVKIFNNVILSDYKRTFKFAWIVGSRKSIVNADFTYLPNTIIDFEGVDYTASTDTISLVHMKDFTFINLNLYLNEVGMNYYQSSILSGTCSYAGLCQITVSEELPQEYIGYIIDITTADGTKFDSRPDADGVPTLRKGIMTIIKAIDGYTVTIGDYLENFSASKTYDGTTVNSTFRILSPEHRFRLNNCNIEVTINAGLSLLGYDFEISNSTFEAKNGCRAILTLRGRTGLVRKCTVKGAYFDGTDTSYGIQINDATNITVTDCEFYNNRRGVDFSGNHETRYCEVSNSIINVIDNSTGSALGGHSPSYANTIKDNKILGYHRIGIQCRGEKEIIRGNLFQCRCSGGYITGCVDTVIDGNICYPAVANRDETQTFVTVSADIEKNTLKVTNNKIVVKTRVINAPSSLYVYMTDNDIHFISNSSGVQTYILTNLPVVPSSVERSATLVYANNIIKRENLTNLTKLYENDAIIDLRYHVISGFSFPVKLAGRNGDLSAADEAKITYKVAYLYLDCKTQSIEGSFAGTVKLCLYFTLSAALSEKTIVKTGIRYSTSVGNSYKTLNTSIMPTYIQGNLSVLQAPAAIYIGQESINGILQAGSHAIEIYL